MASGAGDAVHERQPLKNEQDETENGQDTTLQNTAVDPNQTAQSLIRHTDETAENDLVSPYTVDPAMVSNAYENPYKETTDTTQNFIRRVPSSDLVPAPFKKFKHIVILSVIALFSFAFTGIFAFRLARNAKMHHSKEKINADMNIFRTCSMP